MPRDRVFYEEDQVYSATLKAVRHAYDLLGKDSHHSSGGVEEIKGGKKELYYLV